MSGRKSPIEFLIHHNPHAGEELFTGLFARGLPGAEAALGRYGVQRLFGEEGD